MVDQFIDVNNGFGRARIVKFTSATKVDAQAEVPFFSTDAIAAGDWTLEEGFEDAWSNTRGWPRTVTFHEGRLYFGAAMLYHLHYLHPRLQIYLISNRQKVWMMMP